MLSISTTAVSRVFGYLLLYIFQQQTGQHDQIYNILDWHGPGSRVQKIPMLYPWTVYALVSHNLLEWIKATINYTLVAPFLTDQVWEQADYDGTSYTQGKNLEKIDLLYFLFPPKKKITEHQGKYDFHHDDVREYEADVGIDADGDQVFTPDPCCVKVTAPMGSGKTSNILEFVAHALLAARGYNNQYFNKLDGPVPPPDGSEKIMILLPNKRLAKQCYYDLRRICHSTEFLDITDGVSVFYFDVTFTKDKHGVWEAPDNLPDPMHAEPCVVSHWHLTKHVAVNRALVVLMLINAAPLRFPFEREVRLPDGSYVRRRLHFSWLLVFEWYWVLKTIVNGEFLQNSHTTPAMLAKWLMDVFRCTQYKTVEGMEMTGASGFDVMLALQPDALRTYHVLWAIDPRDPQFFPRITLPKTAYDGLFELLQALLNFEKKMVWVYCNCKSTALNVVDVCNIDLKVYKPYFWGNGEFVNPKLKDLVRLYGENAEKPEEFRTVSYDEFRRIGGKIRKAVVAGPTHWDASEVRFSKVTTECGFVYCNKDCFVTADPFNSDLGNVVGLLTADTVLSDGGDWLADEVRNLGEGTWPNRHIKVVAYSATAALGLSGTQRPSKIDLSKVHADAQTIEDRIGHAMMIQHAGNDK